MPNYDVIVIGASTGGIEALSTLFSLLPKNLPAAILVVLHLYPHSESFLPTILERAGKLPAHFPKDREPIEWGCIYVAPPNRHMILENDVIRLNDGPRENRTRPAIDPLFRSAAQWYGARAIGIVLSGMLDDGTAGLAAIKAQGGVAIAQDPNEALAPSMPMSAIKNVAVDRILPISKIAAFLIQLTTQNQKPSVPPSQGE